MVCFSVVIREIRFTASSLSIRRFLGEKVKDGSEKERELKERNA